MLWNSIYDFFVTKIFGGISSTGSYGAGYFGRSSSGNIIYNYAVNVDLFGSTISFGNYLSLIATLISIILILILCCLFVYKLVRIVAGLMTHR